MNNDVVIPGACVESVKALKDSERGRLWLAAIVYKCECRELSLAGGERYLWPEFKAAIDKQRQEEAALRLARREAGKASARVRNKAEQNEQVFNERNAPLSPPLPLSPTPPISNPPIIPPKEKNISAQREADFETFWKAYPKKKGGKQNALKSFLKSNVPLETLLAALEAQKHSEDWMKDNGKYIPYPTTWLNQGRWEDEVDTCTSAPVRPKTLKIRIDENGREVAYYE